MANEPGQSTSEAAGAGNDRPTALIVLGMHRSGTSVLSGTLGLLGGGMPIKPMASAPDNQTGFWEPTSIVELHEELLSQLDLISHIPMVDSIGKRDVIEMIRSTSSISDWVGRLVDCVGKEFEPNKLIVIKDPRMCRLMPLWVRVLKELGMRPAVVMPLRHPLEVAASLKMRNSLDAGRAMWLWMDHVLRAEFDTRGLDRVVVRYSDLITDWRSTTTRLDKALGLGLDIDQEGASVDRFISKEHRHHRADESQTDGLPDIVRQAYEILNDAAQGDSTIDTDAMDRTISVFDEVRELSARWIADAEQRCRSAYTAIHHAKLATEYVEGKFDASVQKAMVHDAENEAIEAELRNVVTQLDTRLVEQVERSGELGESLRLAESELAKSEGLIEQANESRDQAETRTREVEQEASLRQQQDQEALRCLVEKYDNDRAEQSLITRQLGERVASSEHQAFEFDQTNSLLTEQLRNLADRATPAWRVPFKIASAVMTFPIRHKRRKVEDIKMVAASSLFDAEWYCANNPDVAAAGVDPAAHYAGRGHIEGREPSPRFHAAWYLSTHRDVAAKNLNPLVHYLRSGWLEGRAIQSGAQVVESVSSEPVVSAALPQVDIEIISSASDRFPMAAVDPDQLKRTTAVAFYLPQFHPIPENDAWWGSGFTEWRNVTRATPQYAGHNQPLRPGALGYYDLRLPEIRERQAELAKQHGIGAFCYHHYWFNGRRVLERPLNDVLALGQPDMPFCICWANENWTRRWDGLEQEVLLHQKHTLQSDRRFMLDLIPTLEDHRYLRVDGKPVVVIYRADLMTNPADTAAVWRDEARRAGLGEIHLCAVRFRTDDPRPLGFDAAIEFPPHHFPAPEITHKIPNLDPSFKGAVMDWAAGVEELIHNPLKADYRLYRCVNPGWDNTARRMQAATIFAGATPERYEAWLRSCINIKQPDDGINDNLVFINAWNEWAEGAILEPTETCGSAMLEATARAMGVEIEPAQEPRSLVVQSQPEVVVSASQPQLADRLKRVVRTTPALNSFVNRHPNLKNKAASIVQRVSDRSSSGGNGKAGSVKLPASDVSSLWKSGSKEHAEGDAKTILVVSHDACLAGAQIVVLELLRHWAIDPSVRVYHLLCGSGALEAEFRTLATTLCIDDLLNRGMSRDQAIRAAVDSVPDLDAALCNTAAIPEAVRACKQRGVRTISYLHELPTTIDSMLGGEQTMKVINKHADEIIVVSEFVRDRLCDRYGLETDRLNVVHMGIFPSKSSPPLRQSARSQICKELGIDTQTPIVLGCGAIHSRKGTDLWVRAAATASALMKKDGQPEPIFVWVGWDQAGPDFRSWCEHDAQAAGVMEQVRFIGVREDTEPYFAGADVFALSSREDPFPLVNLESLVCGTPVVAFANAGGAPEALIDKDGDSGIVIGYADAEAMGRAIAGLLGDSKLWDSMSTHAVRVTTERLGWDRYINGLLGALLPVQTPKGEPVEA